MASLAARSSFLRLTMQWSVITQNARPISVAAKRALASVERDWMRLGSWQSSIQPSCLVLVRTYASKGKGKGGGGGGGAGGGAGGGGKGKKFFDNNSNKKFENKGKPAKYHSDDDFDDDFMGDPDDDLDDDEDYDRPYGKKGGKGGKGAQGGKDVVKAGGKGGKADKYDNYDTFKGAKDSKKSNQKVAYGGMSGSEDDSDDYDDDFYPDDYGMMGQNPNEMDDFYRDGSYEELTLTDYIEMDKFPSGQDGEASAFTIERLSYEITAKGYQLDSSDPKFLVPIPFASLNADQKMLFYNYDSDAPGSTPPPEPEPKPRISIRDFVLQVVSEDSIIDMQYQFYRVPNFMDHVEHCLQLPWALPNKRFLEYVEKAKKEVQEEVEREAQASGEFGEHGEPSNAKASEV